jgi:hypothetical protein
VTGIAGAALMSAAEFAMPQAGNEWPTYGGDQSNTRYSTLKQITTGNVKNLRVAWMHSLGSLESQESTPLIVGDTMYVTTSTGPKYVFALDARPENQMEVRAGIAQRLFRDGVLRSGQPWRGLRQRARSSWLPDAKLVALDQQRQAVDCDGRRLQEGPRYHLPTLALQESGGERHGGR